MRCVRCGAVFDPEFGPGCDPEFVNYCDGCLLVLAGLDD